jgi:hypothetical protein
MNRQQPSNRPATPRLGRVATPQPSGQMLMNAYRHGLPEVHLFEFTASGLRCDVLFGDA